MMDRRAFLKNAGMAAALSGSGLPRVLAKPAGNITVVYADSDFEREALLRPFGFKGGYLTELWQVASRLQAASGKSRTGVATQSVLYGDAEMFASHTETEGNALMYLVAVRALKLIRNTPFTDPVMLQETIFPQLMAEARQITGKKDLHTNFVYNALVSADNAAWLLYAAENGLESFDAMVPAAYKKGLTHRNSKVAVTYQVPYGMPVEELQRAAAAGYFVFKIKTGYPGTQAEMLEKDMQRLSQVHRVLKDLRTPHTATGKLIYTLDANGRYEKKELLLRYLDHAKKTCALEHILFYEEPLAEQNDEDVSDTGIRMAADESVHDEAGALRRIEQGYTAMVLKGIAKTLTLSMKIAALAAEKKIPCLCADLTVNPVLVEWNKNIAARLMPFPGIGMGIMETNGDMNYRNWKNMTAWHPLAGASWTQPRDGVFELNEDYYRQSGGIFLPSAHYEEMFHRRLK